jgi:hypothetical protein
MKVFASDVHVRRFLPELEAAGAVQALGRQDEGFGHGVIFRHHGHAGMDQGLEGAVRARADRDPLLGQRAPADHAVHAFARQHHAHRPLGQARGRRRQHLVLPQRLAAETAADERRAHMHLVFADAEHMGQRPGRVRHRLGRVVDAQLVAVPGDGGRVQLDRIVVVARRAVDRVDVHRRGGQRLLGVADFHLQGLALEAGRRQALGPGRVQRGDGRLGQIGHADQRPGMVGLFLGLGQHQRHRLAVPVDLVVLEDRQLVAAGGLGRRHEQRHRLHLRRVLVAHHQHHAGRAFRAAGVEGGDAALGHGAVDQGRIGHILQHHLGREARLPFHFQRAVEARHRGADDAVLLVDQRIGMAARQPAVGRGFDRLLHHLLCGFLDAHG